MPTSITEATGAFLTDCRARNLAPSTVAYYGSQLGWFADWLRAAGVVILGDVQASHIRGYLVHLQTERGWRGTSAHTAMRAIKAWLRFCVAEELIARSPAANVRMPRQHHELKPAFTSTEIRRLLDAAEHVRDRALVLCLLDTGCRASELLAWHVEDVDLGSGAVRVRETKAKRERIVYLGKHARRELRRLFDEDGAGGAVWKRLDTGDSLSYYGLRSVLQRLGTAAKVRPCNPHKFRRTFALTFLRDGGDVFTLQILMGHSDLAVLRGYLAQTQADLAREAAQHGVVDRMLGE